MVLLPLTVKAAAAAVVFLTLSFVVLCFVIKDPLHCS